MLAADVGGGDSVPDPLSRNLDDKQVSTWSGSDSVQSQHRRCRILASLSEYIFDFNIYSRTE